MYQSNPNMFIYGKIFNETISSINSNNEIGVGWGNVGMFDLIMFD